MGSCSFSSFILPLLLLTFSSMTSDTMVAEARNLLQSALPLPKVPELSKLGLPLLPEVPDLPKVDLPLPPLPKPQLPAVPIPQVPTELPPLQKSELPAIPKLPNISEIPKSELTAVTKPEVATP